MIEELQAHVSQSVVGVVGCSQRVLSPPIQGINAQDISKLKVRLTGNLEPLPLRPLQSAALNTVSGVNMTPRRQLLKIKVRTAPSIAFTGLPNTMIGTFRG